MGGRKIERYYFSVIPWAQIHDNDLGKDAVSVYVPSSKL